MQYSSSTSARTPLPADQIEQKLEQWLEVEFSLNRMDELAALIAALSREDQDLLLGWVRRIATTNTHLAHQFAIRAIPQLQQMAAQGQAAQQPYPARADVHE